MWDAGQSASAEHVARARLPLRACGGGSSRRDVGDDFEACSFINVLLELGSAHPAGRASIEHRENIREVVRQLAEEARLSDSDSFARSWHILMNGSIVSAAEGDPNAAQRAKAMSRRLIGDHSDTAPAIAGLA